MKSFRSCFASLVVAAVLIPLTATAADLTATWPQWRGPNRDGQAPLMPAWPDRVDDATLVQQWRVELGPSYSGLIVAADRVFVTETRVKKTEVV